MPISSIQATIAKLSIRPPGSIDPDMEVAYCPEEQPIATLPDLTSLTDVQTLQYPCPPMEPQPQPPPSFSPPLTSPTDCVPPPNGLDAASPCTTPPSANHQPLPEAAPSASPPPTLSSLELLASLTPEAFSMEGGGKGKQRVTKQSFLQPAEGQGLHGSRGEEGDDPLSSLDPLWSLNKQ